MMSTEGATHRTQAMHQSTDYGPPMKPELLGLGRQIVQINSEAFGVFLAELSAPILVKFRLSEKDTKFEKIFHLEFDAKSNFKVEDFFQILCPSQKV